MGMLEVMFDVPDWVEEGVQSGAFQIFGGVIRNSEGEIVCHLKEAIAELSKSKTRYVIIGLAVTAVAGGAYYVYKKVAKKGEPQTRWSVSKKVCSVILRVRRMLSCLSMRSDSFQPICRDSLIYWRRPHSRTQRCQSTILTSYKS